MPRISFLDIVSFLESLAEAHQDIKGSYRWNVAEFTGKMRKGVELPVMLIDAVETQSSGDKSKRFHGNSTAFTILDKPDTNSGMLDEYQAQNQVLNACQQICFDVEDRILFTASVARDDNNVKNWLYGLVDENSFHHVKVGPIFVDGLFGYRCEVTLKNQIPTVPDISKWKDL
ncbi:hypothetical protein HCG49_17085 [Arenibacter sp. 6A1]|uniref:hypothetical protein n=1 Tax=Arenibacter sp. 6A1 TaxID=2720391 RepID=UPI001444EEFF|nr:hypothetical protein [Arenibacter sp. 6A1]NKI28271.1 hypothetical protein [Arenibacter sp. 6A1]